MTKRRIFIGGLDTDKGNLRLPDGATTGDIKDDQYLISFKTPDNSPLYIHIEYPDNIVIADYNWLKENWYKENKGSTITDCILTESKKIILNGETLD